MTTHLSNLEFVRRKCQEVNPDIGKYMYTPEIDEYGSHYHTFIGKEPTLSDVLLAIGSNSVLKINNLGGFSWFIDNEWKDIALPRWNLLLPFSQQSEETLSFLRSLLEQ